MTYNYRLLIIEEKRTANNQHAAEKWGDRSLHIILPATSCGRSNDLARSQRPPISC